MLRPSDYSSRDELPEFMLRHDTELREQHSIAVRFGHAVTYYDAQPVIEQCRAAAEAWAEQQGLELTNLRGYNHTSYRDREDVNAAGAVCCTTPVLDYTEVGVQWTIDVGHSRDDVWTWSSRWAHWRVWFESMRLAAQARGGVLRAGSTTEVLFRDVNPDMMAALQDPDWDTVIDGDNHVVAVHPREDDDPFVLPFFPDDGPGLAGPSGIPHFTLSAPPGFLPPGDYTITRTRIPGPDVDAVHDAAWADDEDDFGVTTGE